MFDFTRQKQETKKFLDILSEKTTCKIRITVLDHSDGTPKGYILNNKVPIKIKDAYYILERENAWYKNVVNKKSIIWSFSKDEQGYNVVLINDIKDTEAFILRDFFLLWNSGNKFQAAFLLDRYVSAEDVVKIQKTLIQIYGGDKRALGAAHNKNMPGFYNIQYPELPYSRIKYIGGNTLDVNYIMEQYKEMYEKKEEPNQHVFTVEQVMRQLLNKPKKTWKDFYMAKQNVSRADISYAIYLMAAGYDDKQIMQTLLKESYMFDTIEREKRENYLKRILALAKMYYNKRHNKKKYE